MEGTAGYNGIIFESRVQFNLKKDIEIYRRMRIREPGPAVLKKFKYRRQSKISSTSVVNIF